MKPLTGGTIMMVLILFAGLGARGVMERWRNQEEARERQRLQIEHNLSVAEKKRVRQQTNMSKPPYDLWKAVSELENKVAQGDPYAQAAYAMVLRDSLQRGHSLTPEYEPVGRLLIGPDYERVVKEVRFAALGRVTRPLADDLPDFLSTKQLAEVERLVREFTPVYE